VASSATGPVERSDPIPPATLTQYDAVDGVRTYPLQGDVTTLGRASSNDIVLPDEAVSRRHCRIYWARDRYVLEDLHSRNGTNLNKEEIQIAYLAPGDTIQVGDQVLQFTLV
jgi:pSer/pThr/pTyr-binding forkhead associated (FHA) protein